MVGVSHCTAVLGFRGVSHEGGSSPHAFGRQAWVALGIKGLERLDSVT